VAGTPGPQAGGIGGLVAFLRDHGCAVEADLKRFYDVRLSDLTVGRLTWRRLSVYLEGLPKDSATAREIGGPDLEWGLAEHLLAYIGDGIQIANWQRAARKNSKPPKPIPRPGVRAQGKRLGRTHLSPAEARARLHQFDEEVSGGDRGR
jgi:hypothetical protein